MIVDRPVRRFLLTWWLCCFLLLLASVAVEQLVFSGIPGGVDVAISTLIVVGEMVRYTLVIAISGACSFPDCSFSLRCSSLSPNIATAGLKGLASTVCSWLQKAA
jgi:hypothetical protein